MATAQLINTSSDYFGVWTMPRNDENKQPNSLVQTGQLSPFSMATFPVAVTSAQGANWATMPMMAPAQVVNYPMSIGFPLNTIDPMSGVPGVGDAIFGNINLTQGIDGRAQVTRPLVPSTPTKSGSGGETRERKS